MHLCLGLVRELHLLLILTIYTASFPDSESPSSSPARKRQRLSSPTYDAQLADLSQDDLDAFDAFEAKLSQDSQSLRNTPHSQEPRERRAKAIADSDTLSGKDGIQENARHNPNLGSGPTATTNPLNPDFPLGQDDPENPFTARFTSASNVISPSKSFFTATSLSTSGFTSAFQFGSDFQISQDHARSPSPEIPLERDYSSWFEPEPALAPLPFQSAKFAAASSLPASNLIVPSIGFMKASEKGWIAPSVAAFTKAQEKMKKIWQEGDPDPAVTNSSSSSRPNDTENAFRPVSSLTSLSSPKRPALRAVQNSFSPGTPTPPAGFSRPSASNTLASVSSASGIHHLKGQTKAKPFKSPFLNPHVPTKNLHVPSASATGSGSPSSPLNPNSRTTPLPGTFVSAGSQHPLASTPVTAVNTTPKRATTSGGAGGAGTTTVFTTPVRPLGSTQHVGTGKNTPATFITPFKAGMKPGEPGRLRLEEAKMKEVKQAASPVAPANPMENWLTRERSGQADGKGKERWKAFDLSESSF